MGMIVPLIDHAACTSLLISFGLIVLLFICILIYVLTATYKVDTNGGSNYFWEFKSVKGRTRIAIPSYFFGWQDGKFWTFSLFTKEGRISSNIMADVDDNNKLYISLSIKNVITRKTIPLSSIKSYTFLARW
jgi:hypothetical protein